MDYFSGWCNSARRLDGMTVVVTGCNTGIGLQTVRDFYLRGAKVIMACRDPCKAKSAKKHLEESITGQRTGVLEAYKLDVSSMKSVREFANEVLDKEAQINILVNNAGVMCCPEGKTEDGFETHMATNHFGHALLTLLLLPKMINSAPSRIVFVSSYLHKWGLIDFDDIHYEKTQYNPIKAYSRSKAANVIFAKALAVKLKEHGITGVTTYSLHPGVINTGIGRHVSDTVWPGTTTWAFNNMMSWFVKSPRCGAQTTIYCAVDEQCAEESGLYYSDCRPASTRLFSIWLVDTVARFCLDKNIVNRFWEVTIQSLKLQDYDPFVHKTGLEVAPNLLQSTVRNNLRK